MKYGDEEIGGKHIDHANMRFSGDEAKAREYIPIARNILGQLKGGMEFNKLDQNRRQIKLQDGTIIGVSSVRGTSDVDQIHIDTRNVTKQTKRKIKSIGYIVQVFCDMSDDYAYPFADLHVWTPSGKVLGFKSILVDGEYGTYDYTQLNDTSPGFPDNGARYITQIGTLSEQPTPYQNVFIKTFGSDSYFDWHGPITYSFTVGPDKPPDGGSWTYTQTLVDYLVLCHTNPEGPVYGGVFADPPRGFINVSIDGAAAIPYGDEIPGFKAYYSGEWTYLPPVGICIGDGTPPPNDSNYANMTSSGSSKNHMKAFILPEPMKTAFDDASAQTYAAVQARVSAIDFFAENYASVYFRMPIVTLNSRHIIRREDGNGIISYSGFSFESGGFLFTKPSEENGAAVLIMANLNSDARFKYADDVLADNTSNTEQTGTYENVGVDEGLVQYTQVFGSGTSGGNFEFADGETFFSNRVFAISADNVTIHNVTMQNCQGAFGIPCECEQGVHRVLVQKSAVPITKIKIHVLTEEDGMFTFVRNDPEFTELFITKNQFNIKIGECDTIGEFLSETEYTGP